MPSEPRIVCAAIRRKDTGDIICGVRHFDRIMYDTIVARREQQQWKDADQGFVDKNGRFLSRSEAWGIAERNGQIVNDPEWQKGTLHSEHLY